MRVSSIPEWEGPEIRLVSVDGLAKSPDFPGSRGKGYERRSGRRVQEVFVTQSGGTRRHGPQCLERYAQWCVDQRSPAQPHTFYVPSTLEVRNGKFEVYRCWGDEWDTRAVPRHPAAVTVCVGGKFQSIHAGGDFIDARPSEEVMEAIDSLVCGYLLPRYNLREDAIRGSFDAGDLANPGDALECWVRKTRGERWEEPPEDLLQRLDDGPLRTQAQRHAAVAKILNIDPVNFERGFEWTHALGKFQDSVPWLVRTGSWSISTERAVRWALRRLSPPG